MDGWIEGGREGGRDRWRDGTFSFYSKLCTYQHNQLNIFYPVNTIINYLYSFLLNITNCKILFAILQYLPKDQLYASLNGKHCKQLSLLLNAPL